MTHFQIIYDPQKEEIDFDSQGEDGDLLDAFGTVLSHNQHLAEVIFIACVQAVPKEKREELTKLLEDADKKGQ